MAPIAKAFIWAAALLGGGVTLGRGYQEMAHKFASVEARQADLPTKSDLMEQRREYERITRRLLENATWWCPPALKSKPGVWVECRVSFETESAPPKAR